MTVVASHVATLLPSSTATLRVRACFLLFSRVHRAACVDARQARTAQARRACRMRRCSASICGFVSGLFTVGGAIFSVPMLTEYFEQPQIVAQATSLAFSLPGVFVSLAVYGLAGDVNWAVGIPLAIGGMSSASFGVPSRTGCPSASCGFCSSGLSCVCAVALFVRARELA